MHWSHGLQGFLKRRYKHPSPTSINGYHTAKKLLSQSPAKRPTFAFADESGYTLGFPRRIAHSGLHGETRAFPPSSTAWSCATSEITLYAVFVTPDSAALLYTYISRFSVNPQHQQKRIIRQSCHHKFYPQPLFNFSYKRPTFAFTSESGHTLGFRRRIAHKGLHGETGAVSDGGGIITLDTSCTFTNIPGPGIRTANFAAFGPWPGALSKNAESLRDSDALMRVAVPRRRGPAGLRDLFRFCRNCGLYTLRSGPFRVCEARGGITTLSALYVLLKHRIAACQKG